MSFSDIFKQLEHDVNNLFGSTYTFSRQILSGVDPITLDEGDEGSPLQYSAVCDVGNYRNSEIDGTVIKQGDLILFASLPISDNNVPEINDTCEFQSSVWRIMNVTPYIINDTITAYQLQMRK